MFYDKSQTERLWCVVLCRSTSVPAETKLLFRLLLWRQLVMTGSTLQMSNYTNTQNLDFMGQAVIIHVYIILNIIHVYIILNFAAAHHITPLSPLPSIELYLFLSLCRSNNKVSTENKGSSFLICGAQRCKCT